MSNGNNSNPQGPARVLARVSIITWVPSDSGRINTTDKHVISVDVWINSPLDDRFKPEDRAGEQAITIAKQRLRSNGIEWLGLVNVQLTEQSEGTIVNQPKMSVEDAIGADIRMRLIQ